MAKTETDKVSFSCGQGIVVFQFAGNIEVSLSSNNSIYNFPAGAGTDSSSFNQLFFAADDTNGRSAGMPFYSFDDFAKLSRFIQSMPVQTS